MEALKKKVQADRRKKPGQAWKSVTVYWTLMIFSWLRKLESTYKPMNYELIVRLDEAKSLIYKRVLRISGLGKKFKRIKKSILACILKSD